MNTFTVGVGQVDITPPFTMPYLAFSPRHQYFRDVHDRLYARSLYVSDGENQAIVISTDTIGLSNSLMGSGHNLTAEIRAAVEHATGVPASRVMLTSSHAHSSVETLGIRPLADEPGAASWLEALKDQIASSAKLAHQDTFEAELRVGRGKVENVSYNRIKKEDSIDQELIVLIFESEAGEKIFVVQFPCHPVIVQAQDLVSADFVGVVQTQVAQTIDKTKACLFLQGACGDINPIIHDTTDFRHVSAIGMEIVKEVERVFAQVQSDKPAAHPAIVRTDSRMLSFPSRPLPDEAETLQIKQKAEDGDAWAEEAVWRIEEGDSPFEGEVQRVRIGDTVLVGIPAEPFSQLGMEIKKRCEPLMGIPVGYANGYLGYIAPPEAWQKGAYGLHCAPCSKVGSESYQMILDALEMLQGSDRK